MRLEVGYDREQGFELKVSPPSLDFLPETTMGHLQNANKEFLLALRDVLDTCIGSMEKEQKKPTKTRIEVK